MLRKEQIEYALHYAENPVEWVFELVRGLEKRIDELVKYGTKVTVFQEHWHPASELPPLDKDGGSGLVYALCKVFSKEYGEYLDKVLYRVRVMHGKWEPEDIEVEWWCYPPKEE